MIGNFRLPISLTSGDTTAPPYVRQTDWLDIDSLVVDGDHKFVGLHAIFEYSNFVSLSASGAYTVDWGDGIVENYATGVQSYHQYDYNSSEFTGTESSRGYRQAIVTVTPQAGQILTNIDLNKKHNQVGLNNYSSGWLDVKISGASISSLFMSGTSVSSAILEQFSFIGLNAVTSMYQMFSGCSSLSSVPLFDTSSVTNMTQTFYQCSSLSKGALLGTSIGVDYDNAKLSAPTLVDVFNNLAIVTVATSIKITGNWGAPLLTPTEKAIATNKGWTIIE